MAKELKFIDKKLEKQIEELIIFFNCFKDNLTYNNYIKIINRLKLLKIELNNLINDKIKEAKNG